MGNSLNGSSNYFEFSKVPEDQISAQPLVTEKQMHPALKGMMEEGRVGMVLNTSSGQKAIVRKEDKGLK